MTQLAEFSKKYLPLVEREISLFLEEHTSDQRLKESMLYSVNAGGKRIRPLLLIATAASFGKTLTQAAYQTAAALEMVHTYSLIHDDLPAMDDDDLRRGNPTNHKVYGEATAILAGDGLLTAAFQLLSMIEIDPYPKLLLIQQLATASGTEGMVSGQTADIQGEHHQLTLEELVAIHERKTGRLIRYALLAGGVLAYQPESTIQLLGQLAEHLGLAFQIRDDVLDISSTTEELGKTAGKDLLAEKNTYPRLLGLEGAEQALKDELTSARQVIDQLKKQSEPFEEKLLCELLELFDIKKEG